MVALGERLVAVELLVAAQAVDLRRPARLGSGTGTLHRLVRERVAFVAEAQPIPRDLEPLRDLVRGGAVGRG
jgi:histidine ammonia-lyase